MTTTPPTPGKINRGPQRRFCELTSRGELVYYKDDTRRSRQGSFLLTSQVLDIYYPHTARGTPVVDELVAPGNPPSAVLDVVAADRRWQFRVPPPLEHADMWRACFEVFRPTLAELGGLAL